MDNPNGRTFEVAGIVATSAVATVTIHVATGLWMSWARIAVRGRTPLGEPARQKREGLAFNAANDELEAALTAISGAAFAIDGFYGSIAPLIVIPPHLSGAWAKNRTRRASRILESLKVAYALGRVGLQWQTDLPWLFSLRGSNVHYQEEFSEPKSRPVMGNVPCERTIYTAENATKAVELMLDVFSTCTSIGSGRTVTAGCLTG